MSIQCSIIWFFTENLAHKADYERHRHVKRWTEDAKRLRAQHSNRNDTNSWLLHRTKKNHCTSATNEQEFGDGRVPWMAHYSCVVRR